MPCNSCATPGELSSSDAREALKRVKALEEALCGLCQQLTETSYAGVTKKLHPQLESWWSEHKKQPGCEAGRKGQNWIYAKTSGKS